MKDRIILLIKAKNFTAAQFADEIGVQKSGISHIISGRNNPSLDFVQKILVRFPEVNMNWLVLGQGPMFSGDTAKSAPPEPTLFTFPESNIQPLDLFTPQISPVKEVKEPLEPESPKEVVSDKEVGINEIVSNETKEPFIEKKAEKELDIKIPAKEEPQTGKIKKLEKVVFFYSDKSFSEYHPEN
jgi:transcriptional regulator with XRE-family HTH domain